jgi:hypothetical protein
MDPVGTERRHWTGCALPSTRWKVWFPAIGGARPKGNSAISCGAQLSEPRLRLRRRAQQGAGESHVDVELLAAPAGRRLDRLGVERELRAVPGRALLLLGFRAGIRFVVDHDVAAFVRDEDVDAARPDLAVDPRGQRSLTRDRAAGER